MPLHPVYDKRLPDGRVLGSALLRPLDEADVQPVVVDVGARNGFMLLPPAYTERATLVGFEPNPAEYEKLVNGNTDAGRWLAERGITPPRFKAERFFPYALWDRSEQRNFYITRGAGACTLMGETTPIARNIYFRHGGNDARRRGTLHDVQTQVVGVASMECKRLDELLVRGEIVDFLKVDVEGAELRVLQGAEAMFREQRILFIRAEFQLVPYYAEHPLLCDQHRFLEDRGFRLLDLEFAHARYHRGPTDLPDRSDRGLVLAGDALYSLDPDRLDLSPMVRQRIAAVALAFGLTGYGLSLIQEAALLPEPEVSSIASALFEPPARSLQGRLFEAWVAFPHKVRDFLHSLRARLNSRRSS